MPAHRRLRELAGLRGSYRYGLVLILTIVSVGVQMALPDTAASLLLQALMMAATVLTALFAEGATRAQWRRLLGVIAVAVAVLIVASIIGRGSTGRSVMFGLSGILAAAGAVIVVRGVVAGIRAEQRVSLHSVLGVVTVYLLAGLIFAFAYSLMSQISGSPVLSDLGANQHADEVYFSFVTLTTTGYGDIVPIVAAARMLAVLEALFGQLYLVTIVAVIVGNATRRRQQSASDGGQPAASD
jgi:drug/metabolite transporter (DMT)-like permease